MAEVALNDAPADGISSIRFAPAGASQDLLVAASWDSNVHIYDTAKNALKTKWAHKAPVLDACFVSPTTVASACLDHEVKLYDIATGVTTKLGKHDAPVRTVDYSSTYCTLALGLRCLRVGSLRARYYFLHSALRKNIRCTSFLCELQRFC